MAVRTKKAPVVAIEPDTNDANDLSHPQSSTPVSVDDLVADATRSTGSVELLGAVGELSQRLEKALEKKAWYEAKVKEAAVEIEQLVATDLVNAMDACNMKKFTTIGGTLIEVTQVVAGSIPAKNLTEALAWLRTHKHEGLIKTALSISLGKGETALAETVKAQLTALGVKVESKETVHAQTLGAWAREMMSRGQSLPQDLLGIYVGRRATVKQSRQNGGE